MKISKRFLCLALSLCLIASVFAEIGILNVAAISEDQFTQKVAQFKKDKSYTNGSTYEDDATYGGYECFGFANEIATYIWGNYPTGYQSARILANDDWTIRRGDGAVDGLCVGDIVRYGNHSIFITGISGETITYCDANSDGNNTIRYDKTISKSSLQSKVSQLLNDSTYRGWVAHFINGMSPAQTRLPAPEVLLNGVNVGSGAVLNAEYADGIAADMNAPLRITWEAVSGAQKYSYAVKQLDGTERDPDSENESGEVLIGPGEANAPRTLRITPEAAVYKIWVAAVDADGTTGHSSAVYLLVRATPDLSLNGINIGKHCISAEDQLICNVGETLTLMWEDIPGASSYCYHIKNGLTTRNPSSDNEPGDTVKRSDRTTANKVSISLEEEGIYKFSVAPNDLETAGWSYAYLYVYPKEECSHSSLSITDTDAPTRTASGSLVLKCDECGETSSCFLPKLNETDYSCTVRSAATCTSTGIARYIWNNRSYGTVAFEAAIPKADHTYEAQLVEPDCTEQGYTEYVCQYCDARYTADETSPLGHDLTETKIDATCEKAGSVTSVCARCDHREITVIPMLPHHYNAVSAAPTCTQDGFTTFTCESCGSSYKAEQTSALGHDWNDGVIAKAPTETAPGSRVYTCTRCGVKRTEVIPAKLHEHRYTAHASAPTCTEPGYTVYVCACGDNYIADMLPPLGHSLAETKIEASCEKAGSVARVCGRCGHQEITVIPATGHMYTDGTCTRCGAKEPENVCTGGETCPSRACIDIPAPASWAHAGIDYCIKNNLMNGTSETLFSPNGTLTRAQLVTILYRVAGEPTVMFSDVFSDVSGGRWYSNAIQWAADCKLVTGYNDGTFQPNEKITREQIAAILYRYEGSPTVTGSLSAFPDASTVSRYAVNAVIWATDKGLITGVKSGSVSNLASKNNATRAQIAAIIMRYLTAK